MQVLKMECTYNTFVCLMVDIRNVQLWMYVSIGVCPTADIWLHIPWHNSREGFVCPMAGFTEVMQCEEEWQPLLPIGGFVEGSYDWSVMSPIAGPSLDSKPPRTILPMEAAMVSRYMDPVELSRTILLALMLEILGIIPPTANMSVEILWPGHVGSGILGWVMVSRKKPWGRVEGWTTANALVGGNVGTVGAPGRWIGGHIGAMWRNGWALPCSLNIPFCWGIPMATSVVSHPSVGGPITQLNRVMEGSWQLSMGLSISRPSRMSRLVMVTNSLMARHSSFMLSTRGQASGLIGR